MFACPSGASTPASPTTPTPFSFGAKTPGGIPFQLPAVDVTDALPAVLPVLPDTHTDTVREGSWKAIPALEDSVVEGLLAHPSSSRVITRIRHRRLEPLGLSVSQDLLLCRVSSSGTSFSKDKPVTVLLRPGSLVDRKAMAALVATDPRSALTYKFNGENTLCRHLSVWNAAGGRRESRFVFYRRFDRRALDTPSTVAKNIANLDSDTADMLEAAAAAAAAGDAAIVDWVAPCLPVEDADTMVSQAKDEMEAGSAGSAVAAVKAAPFSHPQLSRKVFQAPNPHKRRGKKGKKKPPSPAFVAEFWDLLARVSVVAPKPSPPSSSSSSASESKSDMMDPVMPPMARQFKLNVDASHFKAVSLPGWFPAEPAPDAITLHYPGFVPIGELRRSPGLAPGYELWVPVPLSALPPSMSASAASDADAGAGAGSGSESGGGSGGSGAKLNIPSHWDVQEPKDASTGSPVAVVLPVDEAVSTKLIKQAALPRHSIAMLQEFPSRMAFYASWLGTEAQAEAAAEEGDEDLVVVGEWSFETVGANYQGNPEGLVDGCNVMVPHTWTPFPSEAIPCVAAAHDAILEAAEELGRGSPLLPLAAYLALLAMYGSVDPEGRQVKEGLVLHSASGSTWKLRRDDFGFDIDPKIMAAHPVFTPDSLTLSPSP